MEKEIELDVKFNARASNPPFTRGPEVMKLYQSSKSHFEVANVKLDKSWIPRAIAFNWIQFQLGSLPAFRSIFKEILDPLRAVLLAAVANDKVIQFKKLMSLPGEREKKRCNFFRDWQIYAWTRENSSQLLTNVVLGMKKDAVFFIFKSSDSGTGAKKEKITKRAAKNSAVTRIFRLSTESVSRSWTRGRAFGGR